LGFAFGIRVWDISIGDINKGFTISLLIIQRTHISTMAFNDFKPAQHLMISSGWDEVLKATGTPGKPIGTVRTEVSLYRQLRRKYHSGHLGCGTGIDEMFAMLEPILFEFNIVTLQEADNHPKNGPSKRFRDDNLPDNLVYNEGIDWALILNNWVLPQVSKETWDEMVAKEAARFVQLGYSFFDPSV